MVFSLLIWLLVGSALVSVFRRLARPAPPPLVLANQRGAPSAPPASWGAARARAVLRSRFALMGAAVGVGVGLAIGSLSLSVVLLTSTVGTLGGVLAGEAVSRRERPSRQIVNLGQRRLSQFVPWHWLALPAASFVADLAVVWAALRPHPTGSASVVCDARTWSGFRTWPSHESTLVALVSSILIVCVLGTALRAVVQRRQAATDVDELLEDDALRTLTARQAIAIAGAAQLFLLSGLAWAMGGGYLAPCESHATNAFAGIAVVGFVGALGLLYTAGSRRLAR